SVCAIQNSSCRRCCSLRPIPMRAFYESGLWITQSFFSRNPDFHHGLLAFDTVIREGKGFLLSLLPSITYCQAPPSERMVSSSRGALLSVRINARVVRKLGGRLTRLFSTRPS